MKELRTHWNGCILDLDHNGHCEIGLSGGCCANGGFGDGHKCLKQPPQSNDYADFVAMSDLEQPVDYVRETIREAMRNGPAVTRVGWDDSKRERLLKAGWHVLLVGCAVFEWRTARTQLRKHALLAAAGWHASAAVLDWFGN